MALRHQSSGWCLRSIYATLDTMGDARRGNSSADVLDTHARYTYEVLPLGYHGIRCVIRAPASASFIGHVPGMVAEHWLRYHEAHQVVGVISPRLWSV